MARQEGPLQFSGKVGNVVGYARGKDNFTRSAGKIYELTEGSKKSGTEFGRGSTASKIVRQAFKTHLLPSFTIKLHNRLSERFREIIRTGPTAKKGDRTVYDGDVSMLRNFEFNPISTFRRIIHIEARAEFLNGSLRVNLPAFSWQDNINAPEKASAVVLGAVCGSFDFTKNSFESVAIGDLIIEKGISFAGANIEIPISESDEQIVLFMMTVSFMMAYGQRTLRIDRKNSQAGMVINAIHLRNGKVVEYKEEPRFVGGSKPETVANLNWQVNGK
jgi:hypothetical protein